MSVAFVTTPDHHVHAVDGHVERPERLDAAVEMLRSSGLLDRMLQLDCPAPESVVLPPLHTQRYLARLDEVCSSGGGWFDPDTYCLPGSCAAARAAVGACFVATDAVLQGQATPAFAAVRPPGHHARPQQAMGFCLLNNVALAVRHAQREHDVKRVAIIDIDVHHGNGTQDAFYDDPSVLYVSTHQHPFYPGTGRADELGSGDATGTNVNIPLPAGCGDAEYATAFVQIVEPVVRRYAPELLFVSLGFDAHHLDPLAMMELSVDGYGALMSRIRALADELCTGHVVVALEGGYDLDAIAWGTRRTVEVLLGDTPTPDPIGPAPSGHAPDINGLIEDIRALHELHD